MCRKTCLFLILTTTGLAFGCQPSSSEDSRAAAELTEWQADSARARLLASTADTLINDSLALKQYREAIAILGKLLETQQDSALRVLSFKAQRMVGNRLASLGQTERSATLFDSLFPLVSRELGRRHQEFEFFLIDFSTVFYKGGSSTQQGIDRYQSWLEEFQKSEPVNTKLVSLCHQIIGTLLHKQFRYAASLPYLEKALSLFPPLVSSRNDSIVLSDLYNDLGVCYAVEESLYQGVHYFQKALALRQKLFTKAHHSLAGSYTNLGVAYGELGEYQRSLEHYQRSLEVNRHLGKEYNRSTSQLYVNIADGYYKIRNYDQSLKYQRQAVAIDRYNKDSIRLAFSLQGLATTLNDIGQYEQALAILQEALAISRQYFGATHSRTIGALSTIADVYSAQNNRLQALEYGHMAAAAFGPDTLDENYAATISDLGVDYFLQGGFEKALHYHKRALKIKREIFSPSHPELLLSLILAGQSLSHQGRYEQAEEYFKAALIPLIPDSLSKGVAKKVTPALISKSPSQYLLLKALHYRAENSLFAFRKEPSPARLEKARKSFKQMDTVRDMVKTAFSGQLATSFLLEGLEPAYASALQLMFEAQALFGTGTELLAEGFYYMEKNRANLIADNRQAAYAKRAAGIPKAVIDEERNLANRLAYYEKQGLEISGASSDGHLLSYQDSVFHYQRKAEAFRRRLRQDYPKYYQIRYGLQVASVANVQEYLPDHQTALLEFAIGEDYSAVIAIYKDSLLYHYNPKDTLALPRVDSLRHLLSAVPGQGAKPDAELRREQARMDRLSHLLYRQLMEPVLAQIPDARQLILIPNGKLGYLPFELLLTAAAAPGNFREAPYLLKKYDIHYEYSATLLLQDRTPITAPRRTFLGLAPEFPDRGKDIVSNRLDSSFLRSTFPGLPAEPAHLRYNTNEVKAIARQLGGFSATGGQASRQFFQEEGGNYRILHLATHAFVNDAFPDYSHLLLAAGDKKDDDPRLYAYELYNMRLNAELAVLSACETGAGRLQRGEGIISLSRAFKYAGCPNIVTSLWKAEDESTKDIMVGFYRHLKTGIGKAEALRQAKLDFLAGAEQQYTHPFFWGAFILIGDNAPVELGGNSLPPWVWIAGLLIISLLGLWRWGKR